MILPARKFGIEGMYVQHFVFCSKGTGEPEEHMGQSEQLARVSSGSGPGRKSATQAE